MRKPKRKKELVLVGGGHSHVQVLRRFAMEPPAMTHLTLVVDTPIAVYSGMVPGFVAGQYWAEELEIDVVPLARRAGARVLLTPALAIDASSRRIELRDRPAIPYDVASIDIGSTVAGLDLPGVRECALPTRPIGHFVRNLNEALDSVRHCQADRPLRVIVVGAGAGGVELAFTLRNRLANSQLEGVDLVLIQGGSRILPSYPESLRHRVHEHARTAGIEILCSETVAAAEPGAVRLASGKRRAFDLLVWVTGAVSHDIFRRSALPTDDRGFVLTKSTLQVEGYPGLFAVGDCATLKDHPETPKAGVYAVRQGPFLIDNLRAALAGRSLRRYRPQGDFLTLLNLGDGSALGSKWGRSFEGRWVMRLKDWIDRRFMRKFQVLDVDGSLAEAFQRQPEMQDEEEMQCGGCAAKLAQPTLARALARLPAAPVDPAVVAGLDAADDAAAVRMPGGDVLMTSIDAFRAFTDDPYLVGRVAAINAISDLYAKGVSPRFAQALVALPEEETESSSEELLLQILAGARAALDPLGVSLLGGHTTTGPALLVGFTIEGMARPDESLLWRGGLEVGHRLILTKALGTGVLFHADMRGLARGPWIERAIASMLRPNADASIVARQAGASAATDVTGFGLVGHLREMLDASGVAAQIDVAVLPVLPGAVELTSRGLRSTFHPENARLRGNLEISHAAASHPKIELLFDPQTSGGLLFGVPDKAAASAIERLHAAGDKEATVIGQVVDRGRQGSALIEITASGSTQKKLR